jgi:hypothetical protein
MYVRALLHAHFRSLRKASKTESKQGKESKQAAANLQSRFHILS